MSIISGIIAKHRHLEEKAAIHVKKGAFHAWLGKSPDQKITAADIAKGKAAGGHAAKMATFAQNFAHIGEETITEGLRKVSEHDKTPVGTKTYRNADIDEAMVHSHSMPPGYEVHRDPVLGDHIAYKHKGETKTGSVIGSVGSHFRVQHHDSGEHHVVHHTHVNHIFEEALEEGGMPSSVIKHKQKLAAMSPEELHHHFTSGGKNPEQHARETAWRHGYGKMSGHYWNKIKHMCEETLDEAGNNPHHDTATIKRRLKDMRSMRVHTNKQMKEERLDAVDENIRNWPGAPKKGDVGVVHSPGHHLHGKTVTMHVPLSTQKGRSEVTHVVHHEGSPYRIPSNAFKPLSEAMTAHGRKIPREPKKPAVSKQTRAPLVGEGASRFDNREASVHKIMHPEMARGMKVGSHVDFYSPRANGDKRYGLVVLNDGKRVKIKDHGTKETHHFKVASDYPRTQQAAAKLQAKHNPLNASSKGY